MARLEVHQYPTRSDNYGVLIHDPETEATAAIDAPDAEELLAALHEKGWVLTHILTTHHHHDHTAGNTIVKRMTGCTIVGPATRGRARSPASMSRSRRATRSRSAAPRAK